MPLEQRTGHLVSVAEPGMPKSCTNSGLVRLVCAFRNRTLLFEAVAPVDEICMRRGWSPREGDERLSAKKRSESEGEAQSKRAKKPQATDKNARRQRSTDLGRALRSIYDDTLRESVPDDFLDLIGKLS